MKKSLLLIILLFANYAWANDVNVSDFGAVPDGKTLTADALQQAIDHCAETGGGMVTVPVGTYLTTTLYLKSNVNLHIRKGAVILGSTDPQAYPGAPGRTGGAALIQADSIRNAAITGLGTINGQGFKKYFPTSGPRFRNIRLYKCENITVKDVTLRNASNWNFRIFKSEGVIVQGVRIYSFANENNDGIDIDGKNITISGCIIDTDDDAMCLKSDDPNFLVENVTISNCVIASNCNAIKFGTSSRRGFKNITISNCVIRRPSEAAQRHWSSIQGVSSDTTVISGLALEVVDGGVMDQVTISNISMTGVQTPLFIRLGRRHGPGTLKNVLINNITATNESLMSSSITGIPGSYVENVLIQNVILNNKGTGTLKEANAPVPEKEKSYPENRSLGYSLPAYGLYVRHVKNLSLGNFQFRLNNPDARPAVMLDDCHHVRLQDFAADTPSEDQPLIRLIQSDNVAISGYQSTVEVPNFLRAEGANTHDIKLSGNDFSRVKNVVQRADGCRKSAAKMMNNFK